MPKPLQFSQGSLIYFQGDPADKVFILQSGKVNLAYKDIETGDDVNDIVQPGEFFGVKSALGRFPREENAVALQNSTLMTFTVPEFEALSMANTRIIMKMLKVFSNQLRKVHKQVASLMEKEDHTNPEAGLYNLGEYYLKAKKFSQARYVFRAYLTYYPAGINASQAASNMQQAENLLSRSAPAAPIVEKSPVSTAKPDFTPETGIAKVYRDAQMLISQQKYQQAYLAFKKIIDANEDAEYVTLSTFESGRCLFFLNKFGDCIRALTMMITKYPKHQILPDALFYVGQSYEKTRNKEQAITFYKQILSMTGIAKEATLERARKALNELEA
ncbi:MAG: cyclic nucleotide-binding domain-containing protein [Treponema sp.]|nr:cyclic nucleotide-binding domain-containing protein [Treponema sp.]